MKASLDQQFADLQAAVAAVVAERNSLRSALAMRPQVGNIGEIGHILKDALENKQGWREAARRILGLEYMIPCEMCSTTFPSGGKRKKFCSDECRTASY